MAKIGRNEPCPCGSGTKYKKCCGRRGTAAPTAPAPSAAAHPGGAEPADRIARALDMLANVDLVRDPWGGDVVVFDIPYDKAIHAEIKRLPGRRFEWRARAWTVPVRQGLAASVAAILGRHPQLVPSTELSEWLAAEDRWTALASVVEDSGRGWFAVGTLSGSPPERLRHCAEERGNWLLLPLDRQSADTLGGLEGVEPDDPARECIDALRRAGAAPPARLELGRDEEGESRFELRTLWGFSVANAFAASEEFAEGEWRDGDDSFELQAERLTMPADPALVEVLEALLAAHPGVSPTAEAEDALLRLREERRRAAETVALSRAEDAELDLPPLGGELRPFQRAGVHYALSQRRTFIADEQGLGKTVQALAAIEADDAYPAVVVCPASMKLTWEREAATWLPGRSVSVVHGRSPAGWNRASAEGADIVVLNYEILEAHLEALAVRGPGALVFDESHYCKDPRRKRTKAAIELSRSAPTESLRLALTGTPILNRPTELPSQLRLLDRLSDFGSGAKISRRFRGEGGYDRLHWHLRAHCYVRRLKRDVLPQLPPKRTTTVPVELDNLREYRLAEEDVIAWLRAQPLDLRTLEARVAAALRSEQLAQLNYLRSLAGRGKLAGAMAWVEDFVASGEPLVVFAHHRELQTALCRRFPKAVHVLGSDEVEARQAAVDDFQAPGGPPLIVCSMQAGSQGLTLTRASNVAFLELDWTPARHDQAEDRCHRIGQAGSVTAWYLLAPDTIDQTMADVLARKRTLIGAVTDGRQSGEESMLAAVVRELRAREEGVEAAAA